jgi:hypothetical protein
MSIQHQAADLERDEAVITEDAPGRDLLEGLQVRLRELTAELEEDEEVPTERAQSSLLQWMSEASRSFPSSQAFPAPFVGTRGDGDLSCEWRGKDKVLLALISPEGELHLHRVQVEGGRVVDQSILRSPSATDTVQALLWFLS